MSLPSSFNYSTFSHFFTKKSESKLKSKEIDIWLGKIIRIQSSSAASAKPQTQQAAEKPSILSLQEANLLLKRLDQLLISAQNDPAHYASSKKQEKIDKANRLKVALLSYQALLLSEQNQVPASSKTSKVQDFSTPKLIGQYENWMSSFKQTQKALNRSRRQAIKKKSEKSNSSSEENSSDETAATASRPLRRQRFKAVKNLSFSERKKPTTKESEIKKEEQETQPINTSFPYDLSAFFEPSNLEGATGITLGTGKNGHVISDPTDPSYVLKKFASNVLGEQVSKAEKIKTAVEEVDLFNRYYGDKSAEVIDQSENIFIRMIKVPGISLDQCIKEDKLPQDIGLLLMDLIIRLNECKIIHMDFHPGNILYDPTLNTLFPIDLSNEYNIYYEASDEEKEQVNKVHSYYFDKLIQATKK